VPVSSAAALSANAAFRDESYQARLDIENGRKPHLSVGRWSTDEDRALYIAGYQRAYVHALSTGVKKPAAAEPDEVDGYRDGISDGVHDQKVLGQFQLDKTERYRTAGARLDPTILPG
jgi:hypothetical protein